MSDTTTMTPKGRTEQTTPEWTRGGVHFSPRVDIFETDRELILYADLPGVPCGDVDLRYEQGELLLHGRVKPRPTSETFLLHEYEVGDFYRVFCIHESIDGSRIEAEFKNGVLTVHLPKVEAARPRQINVRGG
jgi:HSP20 family molecular chaperone IbpA